MKKKLFYIFLCLTIIGIPIVIYCIKKKKFIKSDIVLKPSFEVEEKSTKKKKENSRHYILKLLSYLFFQKMI